MHIIDAIVKGILLGLFMAISVGPTLFAIIKYSIQYSYKAGLAFVFGVSASDILYVTIANFAASWLIILEAYKAGISYGGGFLLISAGLVSILKKQKIKEQETNNLQISNSDFLRIWTSGFLINSINPGVFISWLAAVTATANTTIGYRVTLFGTCLVLILSIDFIKVFLAEKIRRQLTEKTIFIIQKISSVILMILGLILVLSQF